MPHNFSFFSFHFFSFRVCIFLFFSSFRCLMLIKQLTIAQYSSNKMLFSTPVRIMNFLGNSQAKIIYIFFKLMPLLFIHMDLYVSHIFLHSTEYFSDAEMVFPCHDVLTNNISTTAIQPIVQ